MSKFKHYLEAVQNKNENKDKVEDKLNFVSGYPSKVSRGFILYMKEKGTALNNRTFRVDINDTPHYFQVENLTVENLKKAFLDFLNEKVKQGLLEIAYPKVVENHMTGKWKDRWHLDYFPDLAKFENLELS